MVSGPNFAISSISWNKDGSLGLCLKQKRWWSAPLCEPQTRAALLCKQGQWTEMYLHNQTHSWYQSCFLSPCHNLSSDSRKPHFAHPLPASQFLSEKFTGERVDSDNLCQLQSPGSDFADMKSKVCQWAMAAFLLPTTQLTLKWLKTLSGHLITECVL